MARKDFATTLKQQLQRCAGFEGDELQRHRQESLDYYFQRPRGDEVAGRSKVVAGDESAMVDANLAQIMDSLASSSKRIAEFDADGPGDKRQAELESDTVARFVMQGSNGWIELQSAIKDALQLRNGVMKVWIERRRVVEYEAYSNVAADALGELLAPKYPGEAIHVTRKWTADSGRIEFRRTYYRRRFRCEAVPLENFLYPKDWGRTDLQDIPICAERHIDSRSDLIALGFPAAKVNKLAAYNQRGPITGAFRNPGQAIGGDHPVLDKSQDLIEWYEVYTLFDADGDGIAERRRVALAWADTEVLEDVPVNIVPYAAGVVLLNQHRMTGISLHDKLKQTQDKHTGLDRLLFDNLNAAIKNRTASLDGAVNSEDLAAGRVNGNIRVNRRMVSDVRQAVMAFSVPDLSGNILANIDALKRERAEMGGAALDMAAAPMQLNERMGSEGLDRVYSVMEQLAAYMTRNVAATLIRSVWLIAHATLREQWREPVNVYTEGAWQSAVPSQWRERLYVTAKPGMSPGERQRVASAIARYLDWQVALAREGMDEVLVYVDGFYKALMDWGRIMEVPLPEQYWRDPASPEAKQATTAKQQQAQDQERRKAKLMAQAVSLEQLRTGVDKYKHDSRLAYDYWREALEAEIAEAKIAGDATVKMLTTAKARQEPNGQPTETRGSSGAERE